MSLVPVYIDINVNKPRKILKESPKISDFQNNSKAQSAKMDSSPNECCLPDDESPNKYTHPTIVLNYCFRKIKRKV